MKIRFSRTFACILVFFSLCFATYMLLRPVYNKTANVMEKTVNSLMQKLLLETGLSVSYKSISPSVLTGINIRNISIKDAFSNKEILFVKKLSLKYSLFSLLKGNILDALKEINVQDATLSYIVGQNDAFVKVLNSHAKKSTPDTTNNSSNTNPINMLFTFLKDFESNNQALLLPCNLSINRFNATYSNKDVTLNAFVHSANVTKSNLDKFDANVNAKITADVLSQKITSDVRFNASVLDHINNSSAVLRLTNITNGTYRIRSLGYLAEYNEYILSLKMLPSDQNIYMESQLSLENSLVDARLNVDDWTLSKLVKGKSKSKEIENAMNINISADAFASYDFNKSKFDYNSEGNLFIPQNALPLGDASCDVNVYYSLNGNETTLNVPFFATASEFYNLSLSGSYDFINASPQGTVSLTEIVLPSGTNLSAEVYVEPLEKGFMCFSPQIMLDDISYNAADLTVIPNGNFIDFNFEISDYSHQEAEKPGLLSLYGSYSNASNTMQASVSVDSLYVDSVLKTLVLFVDKKMAPLLLAPKDLFNTTILSCDIFVSSVGLDFSFNVPVAIIANTKKASQMMIVSMDGNKDSLRLSRFELLFGNQIINVIANAERLPGSSARILDGRLDLNEIPYYFTGIINNGYVAINGDYNLEFSMTPNEEYSEVNGALKFIDFPFNIKNGVLSCTTDTNFFYSLEEGFDITFNSFVARVENSDSWLKPTINFSCHASKKGVLFTSIGYSDTVSSLNGNGNIIWSLQDNIFNNASFNVNLSNLGAQEKIALQGELTNPFSAPFSLDAILNDFYFALDFNIDSLYSKRFVQSSTMKDTVNAQVSLTGPLSNPFVSLSIPNSTFTIGETPFNLIAHALLEDKVFTVHDANINFGETIVNNLKANLSLEDLKGNINFDVATALLEQHISTSVDVALESLSPFEFGKIPDSMSLSLTAQKFKGLTSSKNKAPYKINLIKMVDDILISSSDNVGISGLISNYTDYSINVKNPLPLCLNVTGVLNNDIIDFSVTDVKIDLAKLLPLLNYNIIQVFKGLVTGAFTISGAKKDPKFNGQLKITPFDFNMPDYFKAHAQTDTLFLNMNGSQIISPVTRCSMKNSKVDATVMVQMNRYAFDNLEVRVQTVGSDYAPLNFNLPQIHIKGDFQTDLDITYEPGLIGISGNLVAKDTNAELGASRVSEIISNITGKGVVLSDDVEASLHITAASRVQIEYATLLRAIVVPGSEIDMSYSTVDDHLILEGNVPIRSGEITYLNTNFYIKNGEIFFEDKEDSQGPRVSVIAEARARDEDNKPVTVSFSVENQYLSNLSPRLTSNPAKSEREIMEILGSIVTGDSNNAADFMLAVGDSALQLVLVRKIENVLRDLLNLDILSIRTMAVQNALKQTMARNRNESSYAVGNFFDNTTVYIGKYLNKSIFADASLRMTYDENRIKDNTTAQGLVFQPEIGLEFESPFAKIRWSIAPDIDEILNNKWVAATSLTLSWKLNF